MNPVKIIVIGAIIGAVCALGYWYVGKESGRAEVAGMLSQTVKTKVTDWPDPDKRKKCAWQGKSVNVELPIGWEGLFRCYDDGEAPSDQHLLSIGFTVTPKASGVRLEKAELDINVFVYRLQGRQTPSSLYHHDVGEKHRAGRNTFGATHDRTKYSFYSGNRYSGHRVQHEYRADAKNGVIYVVSASYPSVLSDLYAPYVQRMTDSITLVP